MSIIIYLIGNPGVGKYTIAKELEKNGYLLCDNHLINNPIFSLAGDDGYDDVSEDAWSAVQKIRDAVFEFIISEQNRNTHSYVLTNVLNNDEGDRNLFLQVENMAKERGSILVPVTLSVSKEEHRKRIVSKERKQRYKSVDLNDINDEELLPIMHQYLLKLDITTTSPNIVAQSILGHCSGLKN